ncbi:MAG: DUF1320 family protein [Flavobacterium nitrogenifigens]|uniref:phage protein Gp36 family protein n=1 Tax=Flavobacterium nitrogenifigens TaxID=1617283 RepID=UPI002807D3F0|nr:phage protein Gp36 family protein [Flavobacterium nitrogenifigens]MDQ8012030.1 DUF1320 family protein [Flavobacterium nitrogenifigens]
MIYLVKDDLISLAVERFIDESSEESDKILDTVELQNIQLIKGYIASRYDVSEIFNALTPIKHEILTRILTKLVLFDIIRRNAARKVPTDYKEEYDKALELLEKIATGRIKLEGLPAPTDENGNPTNSTSIWGNNSNPNFYI